MGQQGVGTLAVGGPADFVLFRGRRYSELLARPQFDRVRRRRRRVPIMSCLHYLCLKALHMSEPLAIARSSAAWVNMLSISSADLV